MQRRKSRYSNGSKRRKLRRRYELSGEPCHLCGYPIPNDVPHMDMQQLVLDELELFRDGGSATDPDNVRPAHRCCNGGRGTQPVTEALKAWIRRRYEREVLGRRKARAESYETSSRW